MNDAMLFRKIVGVLEESKVPHNTLPPAGGCYFWNLPLPQQMPVAAMMSLQSGMLTLRTMIRKQIPQEKLMSVTDYACSLETILTLTTPRVVDDGLLCESMRYVDSFEDFENRLLVFARGAPLQALMAGIGLELVVGMDMLGSQAALYVRQQLREMGVELPRNQEGSG